MNKKLLTTLTSAAMLAAGVLAGPASAMLFGSGNDAASIDANSQLDDVYYMYDETLEATDVVLDGTQQMIVEVLAYEVGGGAITPLSILTDPSQIAVLNDGGASVRSESEPPSGFGVYEKGGCKVDAGCGFGAVGVKIALVCSTQVPANYGDLYDPEAWSNCIYDRDPAAHAAAVACTYGTCPGFSSIVDDELYACNDSAGDSVMAMFN